MDGDVDKGDALPRGTMDDRPPRRTPGPEVTLAGDGSPLVAEWRPPEELTEPTLRWLRSVLPDRDSGPSSWLTTLPLLVVQTIFSWVSSAVSFGRFPSGQVSFSEVLGTFVTYLNSKHALI